MHFQGLVRIGSTAPKIRASNNTNQTFGTSIRASIQVLNALPGAEGIQAF